MLEKITRLHSISQTLADLRRLVSVQTEQFISAKRAERRLQNSRSLVPYGFKIFSQGDEDGIVREIFNRIGTANKTFVEFGVGNGLENNTLALLLQGWSGLWIEANAAAVAEIRRQGAPVIEAGRLNVLESFITRENINRLIVEGCRHREVDLLSIDIDGNDLHIFKAIECISPRVLVLEYNAKFPPPMEFCIEYDPAHGWTGDDYFGASLKSCEIACADRGYCLVGCSLTGANAFFVRQDLVQDLFVAPFTAETHYEPPRYHLTSTSSGHPVSFKSLAHAVVQR